MEHFRKLTEKEIWTHLENGENITDFLVDNVSTHFFGTMCDLSSEFELCLADCESPIEQLLAIYLESLWRTDNFDIPLLVDAVAIEKQYEVNCDGKTYRADFAIPVIYWNKRKIFIIECDGYDFHQKTKKQVEADNKRTRALQLAGYEVIRFSGTEIYHRPYQCALEIKRLIQAPAINFLKEVLEKNGGIQNLEERQEWY